LVVLVLVVAVLGCGAPPAAPAAVGGAWSPPPRTRTSGCVAREELPDPACTPGAVDVRVGQANLSQTVCRSGYTRTVRPPRGVTDEIKRRAIRAYGAYAGGDPRGYELDHLVSLALGGAPADEANLWPEARNGPQRARGAEAKDAVESYLHDQICRGRMTLADAQRAIATNWVAVYDGLPERLKREVGEDAGEGN
jgi:hypothetical protein